MSEENIDFRHQDSIQIRFNDIDGLGHVNNTTIQEYFDLGRLGYFNKVFDNNVNWSRFGAVVASIKTDFLAPVFLKESLVVKTKVKMIGDKSMQLIQHITDSEGVIKATCSSAMVGYDPNTHTSRVIPEDWRKRIGDLEGWE
ncbi:acyl-CoA thioesterase [Saccharicrinis fermentans]|uniref:Acyl-CoA thioesterase YbgC n=1 Tax=Saccharicrinis fermentans DSM 9555 = JCM 21142 TaxID=869213 RepID=W7YH02_9BACT|nr:thioesterase family protein [Saccharicrinis fermentans]GAF01879.1 acyl-CoA thioesterase YbgC [Saccharicrinis fermentans DSM 9555 = JCM 21142]